MFFLTTSHLRWASPARVGQSAAQGDHGQFLQKGTTGREALVLNKYQGVVSTAQGGAARIKGSQPRGSSRQEYALVGRLTSNCFLNSPLGEASPSCLLTVLPSLAPVSILPPSRRFSTPLFPGDTTVRAPLPEEHVWESSTVGCAPRARF